jgi:hypothetical protein
MSFATVRIYRNRAAAPNRLRSARGCMHSHDCEMRTSYFKTQAPFSRIIWPYGIVPRWVPFTAAVQQATRGMVVEAEEKMSAQCTTSPPGEPVAVSEKIGITRIKIHKVMAGATAFVGSFTAADCVLAAWAKSASGPFECEFEIAYRDTLVLRGRYWVQPRPAACSSLTRHVRRAIQANLGRGKSSGASAREGYEAAHGAEARTLRDAEYLECYEIDDFSLHAAHKQSAPEAARQPLPQERPS